MWLLTGYYGGRNTGDDAMLEALLISCSPTARCNVVVVTKDGTLPPTLSKLGLKSVRATPIAVARYILKCRCIVQAGGTNFHDDFTGSAFRRHLRSLAIYALTFVAARLLGKSVLMIGIGVGPFFHKVTRVVTRVAVSTCNAITVRDEASLKEVASWISPDRLSLTFDLSSLLAPVVDDLRPCRGQPILGISPIDLTKFATGGPDLNREFWDLLMVALEREMELRTNLHIRIFVMNASDRHGDTTIAEHLCSKLSRTYGDRITLIPYNPDPATTLAAISECSAFIAARYHAGLLAYFVGCDLMLVPYHRKVRDLARTIELSEGAVLDPTMATNAAFVAQRLSALLSGTSAFRPRLPRSTARSAALDNLRPLVLHGICSTEQPFRARTNQEARTALE